MTPTFQDLASLFPAVLAPALVAHLRRRWPALDGGLVWLAVVLAAVLFSLAIAALFGQAPSLVLVRQGVLLGAGAAAAHTVATGRPSAKPAQPEPPREPVVDPAHAWGPRPSDT